MKTTRRNFIKQSTLSTALIGGGLSVMDTTFDNPEVNNTSQPEEEQKTGAQRLPLEKLKKWEALEYGMFIHFGMSTFTGEELDSGKASSSLYNPTKLNVGQWIQVARDAGMKYAVLTTKHVSGHCLWPSKYTDYHVGTSGKKTDVVEAFVSACRKYGIMPGFYYCSWDNHHLFGSGTPSVLPWSDAFTTSKYRDFQLKQVEELLTRYGEIGEAWIDIPGVLTREGRQVQYDQIISLMPDAVVMMNNGLGEGDNLKYNYSWPTDLMAIERYLPKSDKGYNPWFKIKDNLGKEKDYYIPGEVCDPVGYEWFWREDNKLRSVNELLGMRLIANARGTNLLLDVPPDKTGKIPKATVNVLMELQKKFSQV